MARNPISSFQTGNLRPPLNTNRGIVPVEKCSQNLILASRIVTNGGLGVFGPNNVYTTISYSFSGENQILRPFIDSNYTTITISKWSQIFILTTSN